MAKQWQNAGWVCVYLIIMPIQPVELGKYIGREIIDILLAWTSFLLIISGIVALVRDDRRSLTDLVAGTVVLKDEK